MPLYEYECDGCGQRFELIRKFSDPPVTSCTTCNGSVRKLFSSPAIRFKGTGWYVTDYARKPSAGQPAAATSADDSQEKSSSDKKSASAESSSSTSSGSTSGSGKDSTRATAGSANR